MQILLANAKIMFDKADRKPISVPLFQSVANVLAEEMARMNVEELAGQLDCSSKIARHNVQLALIVCPIKGFEKNLAVFLFVSILSHSLLICSHKLLLQ